MNTLYPARSVGGSNLVRVVVPRMPLRHNASSALRFRHRRSDSHESEHPPIENPGRASAHGGAYPVARASATREAADLDGRRVEGLTPTPAGTSTQYMSVPVGSTASYLRIGN